MKSKFNFAALTGPILLLIFWGSLFLLRIYR